MTSPNEPDPADPLATAQYLGASLIRLAEELKDTRNASERRDAALERYGRGNRHRIWLSYVLIAFDVALSVVAIISIVRADYAASAANQNRQQSAASCVSGNDLRGTLNQVFDHVFGSFGPPKGTPAQQAAEIAQLKALEEYYHGKFAARNCATYGAAPASTGKAP